MYRLIPLLVILLPLLTGCSFWTRSGSTGDQMGTLGISNDSSWFILVTVVVLAYLSYRWLDKQVAQ